MKVREMVMGFVRMVVSAMMMAAVLLLVNGLAFGQDSTESVGSISKNLRIRHGILVPVVEWGNLGDPDNWYFKLNGGQLAVGAEVGWWEEGVTEEKDRKPLDWDIGVYTFLMAENGEVFYVGLGVLWKTLKYKGRDLLALGFKE